MRLSTMRTAVVIAAALMIAPAISLSQSATEKQNADSKLSIVYSPSPSPLVTVTNNYSSPLTGMVITISGTVAPYKRVGIVWFDAGLNFRRDTPLKQGGSRKYGVPSRVAQTVTPVLGAAIFEDGTVIGDAHWLSKLHARRQSASDEIRVVTKLLNESLTQHRTNDQIISSLKDMHASLSKTIPDQEQRMTAGLVIYAAITNLEHGGVAGSIGDPQKTIPAAILPMFDEWHSSLTRYDKSVN